MINWSLLTPRNLFVVAVMAVGAYMIFNHFAKGTTPVAVPGA